MECSDSQIQRVEQFKTLTTLYKIHTYIFCIYTMYELRGKQEVVDLLGKFTPNNLIKVNVL